MANPLCPYFGICGGCTAQHIDYVIQLENKKTQLAQITKYDNIQIVSDAEYFYRNRMDFLFLKNSLGLRKKGHWDRVVSIERCVIAEEKINTVQQEIQTFFTGCDVFDLRKHTGTFRYAVIRCTEKDSSISFVLNSNSSKRTEAIEQVKSFAQKTTAKNVLITSVPPNTDMSVSSDFFVVKGKELLETSIQGKTFFYPIQGFFQNNYRMTEKMHEYVTTILKKYPTKGATLLDLYGGVSTFGILNADLFETVVIIENAKESIAAAKKNCALNTTTNVTLLISDAKHLPQETYKSPLFVITDPPRSGMDQKVLTTLKRYKPECIVYVSCNPQQLGKDLLKFPEYTLKSLALFDLFPQTSHSEAIAELQRKPSTVS